MPKETLEDVSNKTGLGSIIQSVYKYLRDNNILLGVKDKPLFTKNIDEAGNQMFNTIFGEATVAERLDSFNICFQYNNGIGFSTKEVNTGSGFNTNSDERAIVHTGTGVGTAKLRSRRTVRYLTKHECMAMFTGVFAPGQLNTYQMLLYGEKAEGLGFGYQNQDFGIFLNLRGITNHIKQADWNIGLPAGFTLDPYTMNIYSISFGWLGIAPIVYRIYCGKQYGWRVVHIEDRTNIDSRPHLSNPNLPVSIEVGRTSGTGNDILLYSSSWGAGIVGKGGKPEDRYLLFAGILNNVFSATVPQSIISVRSKTTYQDKTNNIRTKIGTVTFSNTGNKDVDINIYRDNGVNEGVLTGGTWVDVDTYGSPCQKYLPIDGTFTPGIGTKLIGNTLVQPNQQAPRISLLGGADVDLDIYAGETIHFAVLGTNTNTLKSTIRMVDEF